MSVNSDPKSGKENQAENSCHGGGIRGKSQEEDDRATEAESLKNKANEFFRGKPT